MLHLMEEDDRAAVVGVYCVYTNTNDPMELAHPEAGLVTNNCFFEMVNTPHDADIVFLYQSLFGDSKLQHLIQSRKQNSDNTNTTNPMRMLMINQFRYKGAFVQKDHLARELMNQHGLPRPFWSLETYDLDVQLAQFAGAALVALHETNNKNSNNKPPLWIVKPLQGTQSKGHVVTRSLAHIWRLADVSGGISRVVQPVCVNGHKEDCRCIVLLTDAKRGCLTLYLHNTFPHCQLMTFDLDSK
jgi:hypothetical protein